MRTSAGSSAGSPADPRRVDGTSLEAILDAHLDKVYEVAREVDELGAGPPSLEATQRRCVPARSGSSASTRSRTPAATRASRSRCWTRQGDGFVVSSLHARAGTRVYAKAVAQGTSEAALSDEESRGAAARARLGDRDRRQGRSTDAAP